MQGHTKKHHTEKDYKTPHKIIRTDFLEETPMSVDEFIKQSFGDLPQWAVALQGLRAREGLTQSSLGKLLGVEQTNISKMELGKRPIGKNLAKKLSELFKIDYRLFL